MCGRVIYPDAHKPDPHGQLAKGNIKGRNKRELKKRDSDVPKVIPSADCAEKGGKEIMEDEPKVCTKCGIAKPVTEFNKNVARPSGRESRCRVCTTQSQRNWIAKKKEKVGGNGWRRKTVQKPGKRRSPSPAYPDHPDLSPTSTDEAIFLERSILLAIEKKVALKLLKKFEQMIQEAYA
jgi:hypothetical protein